MGFTLDKLIAATLAVATFVVLSATLATTHAEPAEPAAIAGAR